VEATLERIRAASSLIRSEAAACESGGKLTDAVVGAIRGAGVYRMTMSRELGGPELSPLEQIEVLEELAAADGSAGWCGMINSDGGYVTSFLDRDVARKLYPSLDLATAVSAQPSAKALIDGDTFKVSGTAVFASGSSYADWFFVNCLVIDDNGMRMPAGALMPETRLCAIPAAEVEVLDTWHATGLGATASNDIRVTDVTVPAEHSFSLFEGQPVDQSALYAWRWMFFVNLSAVPLGVARAALAEAKAVAEVKVIFPSMTLARDDAMLQWNLGKAEALVASARAYVFDTVGRFWESLCAGRTPTAEEWMRVRLGLTYAFQSCKEAVTLLYEALGTTGVFRSSPLDRQLRDTTTMAQHILCQTKTYANCGRSLLGLDPGGIAF
jgi:indole-3-acetate monooxygenase